MPRAIDAVRMSCRASRPPIWVAAAMGILAASQLACDSARDADTLEVFVRGHSEVRLEADGSLVPIFLGWPDESAFGLCVGPSERVARTWRGTLKVDGRWVTAEVQPASRMAGRIQCFEAPTQLLPASGRPVALCGEVEDEASGDTLRLPCRQVVRVAEDTAFRGPYRRWAEFAAGPQDEALEAWLGRLDEARHEAERVGALCLAQREALMAVSFTITAGQFGEARRRLAAFPAWLEQPAASRWAGLLALESARLAAEDGRRLEQAWRLLESAERKVEQVAAEDLLNVAREQARILILAGASEEADARLSEALSLCQSLPCGPKALRATRGQLAWLRLLDPDASMEKLAAAGRELELTRPTEPEDDPLEAANTELSLAYGAVRQGHSPDSRLEAARHHLAPLPSSERRRLLLGWATLIEGLAALESGRPAEAQERCGRLLESGASPQLLSWARSCLGKAQRHLGQAAAARQSFEQALVFHELAIGEPLGQQLELGPGQRADDFYQAARVAVETGQPEEAWALLDRLDRLSVAERARPCAAGEIRSRPAAPNGIEARQRQLRHDLELLSAPAGRAERLRREPRLRAVKKELQELARRLPPCAGQAGLSTSELAWGWRAFALPDEVMVLARPAGGEARLLHRAVVDRRGLKAQIRALEEALDRHQVDDSVWRPLAAPIAAALLPRAGWAGEGETPVSLYGLLQGVPLAALPLPEGGWFGDRTTVVNHGAIPSGDVPPAGAEVTERVFVVDPRRNLSAGGELARFYRELFPRALVLEGAAASREALTALRSVELLHLDVHGHYDDRFPELSSLELADGSWTGAELAELPVPRQLVNLSGCGTGRWRASADSGRYGLAGFLLGRGVPWVVASSSDLGTEPALTFNQEFYRQIARGRSVLESYREAHALTRRSYPASSWGGLMLLRSFFEGGGQSSRELTPEDP